MSKKYGGVKNWKNLDEVQEAVTYAKPPVHYTNWQICKYISIKFLTLFPLVFITMLGIGLIFVLIGNLNTPY